MRVLALSPHTDDAELGAGGYLARLIAEGHTPVVVAFSTGNSETGASRAEFRASMVALGVELYQRHDYETRRFPAMRQTLLDQLIELRESLDPELVLVPASSDVHQDHQTITAEALRAFRRSSILGYELPWSNVNGFDGRYYVRLNSDHIKRKLAALQCYESQAERQYMRTDAVMGLARARGLQVGVGYAECFEVLRWIS